LGQTLGSTVSAARSLVGEQTVRVARDETMSLILVVDKQMLDDRLP
jgi:hypothetical protein